MMIMRPVVTSEPITCRRYFARSYFSSVMSGESSRGGRSRRLTSANVSSLLPSSFASGEAASCSLIHSRKYLPGAIPRSRNIALNRPPPHMPPGPVSAKRGVLRRGEELLQPRGVVAGDEQRGHDRAGRGAGDVDPLLRRRRRARRRRSRPRRRSLSRRRPRRRRLRGASRLLPLHSPPTRPAR